MSYFLLSTAGLQLDSSQIVSSFYFAISLVVISLYFDILPLLLAVEPHTNLSTHSHSLMHILIKLLHICIAAIVF